MGFRRRKQDSGRSRARRNPRSSSCLQNLHYRISGNPQDYSFRGNNCASRLSLTLQPGRQPLTYTRTRRYPFGARYQNTLLLDALRGKGLKRHPPNQSFPSLDLENLTCRIVQSRRSSPVCVCAFKLESCNTHDSILENRVLGKCRSCTHRGSLAAYPPAAEILRSGRDTLPSSDPCPPNTCGANF